MVPVYVVLHYKAASPLGMYVDYYIYISMLTNKSVFRLKTFRLPILFHNAAYQMRQHTHSYEYRLVIDQSIAMYHPPSYNMIISPVSPLLVRPPATMKPHPTARTADAE